MRPAHPNLNCKLHEYLVAGELFCVLLLADTDIGKSADNFLYYERDCGFCRKVHRGVISIKKNLPSFNPKNLHCF